MFNIEDELVLELHGYRVPWLIWINLVVLFLLFILLYYFTVFGLDFSEDHNSLPSSSSSSAFSHSDKLLLSKSTTISRSLNASKVGEHHIIKGDIGTSTSRIVREGASPREGCSFKNLAGGNRFFDDSHSPCYFLELAKKAFLKCLGLDRNSDDSSSMEQRKDK